MFILVRTPPFKYFIGLRTLRRISTNSSILIKVICEWRQINYLIKILYPFALYIDVISAIISGPTVHNVFAVYNKLFGHIESHIEKLKRKRVIWKVTIRHGLELANDKLSIYYNKIKDSISYIYNTIIVLIS